VKRAKDVRDKLIEAAVRFAENELAIKGLTKRMRAERCATSPPCWARDPEMSWRFPGMDLPDDYCDACVASTILRRKRHEHKVARASRRESLIRATTLWRGSIYGACSAGPAAGSGGVNRDQNTGGPPCSSSPSTSVSSSV
jgi:hypothetical protein